MKADPCNQLVNIKTGKIRCDHSNSPQKEDNKNLRKDQFVVGLCDLFYCMDDFFTIHKSKDINKTAGCILKIAIQNTSCGCLTKIYGMIIETYHNLQKRSRAMVHENRKANLQNKKKSHHRYLQG